MSAVTLELAKAHMKVDGTAEDELISLYIEAAEQWAGNYIGKPIADLVPVPADVKLAILRLVSFYFECRNIANFGLSMQLAPQNVASILDSYREKWFTDGE
ncbi:head-tail connector protein [Sinorhizobium meliloti]|uniref:head-tail connector protein n=1 Tax=Rhizobium meliloti TaxID=382 RepID=UPI000FDBC614|nr:head-tail connector protein [Sinorhizobium meliloti]RVG96005.1 phage gp6-like head-tail connector protein [Sinorhizobium meliloti]WQP07803.1 head-tail connector protein [Sinorhizobium meliloti]WQP21208.1 head-tail connector protein [Sinorhizobium meliloti]WQP34623.1 head-tail connector protein [Sinorhizobium meliloti]